MMHMETRLTCSGDKRVFCIEAGHVETQAQAAALIRIIELVKPLLSNGGGHAEASPSEAPQGPDKTPPGYLRDPVAGERARRGAAGGGEPDHAASTAGAAGGDGAGAVKKYGPPDINEISDLCMTSFVTDKMTADEVNEFYQGVLLKIYDALYPELPGVDAAPDKSAT